MLSGAKQRKPAKSPEGPQPFGSLLPPCHLECKFLEGRRFRFDYCWHAYGVAVEVQGGVWSRGKHGRGSGIIKDYEKLNLAQIEGWIVLQVTPEDLRNYTALPLIEAALKARGWNGRR